MGIRWFVVVLATGAVLSRSALAEDTGLSTRRAAGSGRLLAMGGAAQIDGAGGGGVVAGRVIGWVGAPDWGGANGHTTAVRLARFVRLPGGVGSSAGEVSGLATVGAAAGLSGAVRPGQDHWGPRPLLRVRYTTNTLGTGLRAVGVWSKEGVGAYVSPTRLFSSGGLLSNATVRAGWPGLGGDWAGSYSARFEGSTVLLRRRQVGLEAELRSTPDDLGFGREGLAREAFAAWPVSKNLSVAFASVQSRRVTGELRQDGVSLLLRAGF